MSEPVCPLCLRPIPPGVPQSRHHLIPKLRGGKHGETVLLHHVCHRTIHKTLRETELARSFNTVCISQIPIFGSDPVAEDAAKRFVHLVDEFYDRNVKLIVSAATAPTELYRGHRHSGDFARTASRLIEMQSTEYLARPHRAG